jgi:hypothetical protein
MVTGTLPFPAVSYKQLRAILENFQENDVLPFPEEVFLSE